MKLTFLGTGTSFGVPQLGCGCAVCRSTDPRDKRTRVGAAVETDSGAVLLIDTPTELRLQLLATRITRVDAVRSRGLAREGDRVVVTAGVPFDVPGTTNLMKVETV